MRSVVSRWLRSWYSRQGLQGRKKEEYSTELEGGVCVVLQAERGVSGVPKMETETHQWKRSAVSLKEDSPIVPSKPVSQQESSEPRKNRPLSFDD